MRNTNAEGKQTNPIRRQAPVAALTLAAVLLGLPAASHAGIVYVSLYEVSKIEKYDLATGADLGLFADASAGLAYPIGLATDSSGNLYVANNGGHAILKFTPAGVGSVFASTPGLSPNGLTFDNAGNLYASYPGSSIIEKFSSTGADLGVFASADNGLSFPNGLASDGAGNIYVANLLGRNILKFSPGGVGVGDVRDPSNHMPYAVAVDSNGTIYGCNNYGQIWGGTLNVGFYPDVAYGLAFDSSDNLYAAVESGSDNRIERYGTESVLAHTGQGAETLGGPWGIAISEIPEPSTCAVFGLGVAALLICRRRR
jgi:hypothetical protein